MKPIQFDTTNYVNRYGFAARVNAWNRRVHRASMAAALRWADKLSASRYGDTKPLRKAHWWAGDPYGKRPLTLTTWARNVAKANPPQVFRYTPPDNLKQARAYGDRRGKYSAKNVDDVQVQLLKLGVSAEQLS